MSATIIQYRTYSAAAEENRRPIEAVVRKMTQAGPSIQYAAFRLDDGVTFVRVAALNAAEKLESISAFTAFREKLTERVVPGTRTATTVDVIGPAVQNSAP
jgi:hypothetical protein